MVAILLSLACSACWGCSDFLGGLCIRRAAVGAVVAGTELAGLVPLAILVAAQGHGAPDTAALLEAAGGGVATVVALVAYYQALAIGTMSVVAPVASTGGVVPVLVGVFTGERPGILSLAGIVVAVVGVVLASREDGGGRPSGGRTARVLALAAGMGFGLYLVALQRAAGQDVAWALAVSRGTSVVVVAGAGALLLGVGGRARALAHPAPRGLAGWVPVAVVGLLDAGANAFYALATTHGLLSITAVASSLYPAVTVLLARVVLAERLLALQGAGVVAVLGGVVLLAAG